jgi:transcriptional regulator with XRE-family HTH domain
MVCAMTGTEAQSPRAFEHEPDDLDELIREATADDPTFAEGLADIAERGSAVRCLIARRRDLGLSQKAVAKAMGTTQSAVSDIESGGKDLYLSTLQRYARAVGARLAIRPMAGRGGNATQLVGTSASVYALQWRREPDNRALRHDGTG